jgi:hypothetical protein
MPDDDGVVIGTGPGGLSAGSLLIVLILFELAWRHHHLTPRKKPCIQNRIRQAPVLPLRCIA